MLSALLAIALQDLDALAGRLAAEDVEVRALAEREILELPARLLPRLLEALGKRAEPEARTLEDRVRIGPSWIALLPGSIRDLRALSDAVARNGHPGRDAAVGRALDALSALPPGRAAELLVPLLAEPSEGARLFALAALRRFPPADPAPLLSFLDDLRTSGSAAEVLVIMGARGTVPRAVDLFVQEGGGLLGAARILEAFGAGGQQERVARAVREKAGLLVWGIRILRATGPAAEPQLLALAPDVSYPRRREIVEALAAIGGPASLPLVRETAAELPVAERDELLWRIGDPDWARAAFDRLRRAPDPLFDFDRLSIAGPALAPDVRARLREPGLAPGLRPHLRLLLGAVGGPEDIPLLEGEALERIGRPPRPLPPGDAAAPRPCRRLEDPATWHQAMADLEARHGVKTEGATTAEQRAFWRARCR